MDDDMFANSPNSITAENCWFSYAISKNIQFLYATTLYLPVW